MANLFLVRPLLGLLAGPGPPAPGTYSYTGEFAVLQKKVTEAVPTNTQKGQARVRELRALGYACQSAGIELARCTAFVSAEGSAAEVKERVDRRMAETELRLGPVAGEPALVAKSEIYEEWEIPQSGSFRGESFEGYVYQRLLEAGVDKLKAGAMSVVRDGEA